MVLFEPEVSVTRQFAVASVKVKSGSLTEQHTVLDSTCMATADNAGRS